MQLNTSALKLLRNPFSLICISIFLYGVFAYDLVRTDFLKFFTLYSVLFICFYQFMQISKDNLKRLTWVAFGFRALFIFSIPNLSQDFYRFIWDGNIILEGLNPYLFSPESIINNSTIPLNQFTEELYSGMGSLSASHYTNYPPLNQFCFVIAGIFAGKSILGSAIVMRLLIIAADFGTLHFGKKLLEKLKLPVHNIFWYILNPFIIIELTGNLHFEGVMLFFLIWSLYLFFSGKLKLAAVIFSFSVSIKLIPLIFLPLFWQKLKWKNSLVFYTIVGFTTLLLFAPFYSSEFIANYFETISLWFNKFEFNASIYYILRAIGYKIVGYNLIGFIGILMPIIVIIYVLWQAIKKRTTALQLLTAMLFCLSLYYFTSTTVHPWYIATLLLLSVFTNYKFPLVWSFAIVLSYLVYSNNNIENMWIITLEYVMVYTVFVWEVFINKAQNQLDFYHLKD